MAYTSPALATAHYAAPYGATAYGKQVSYATNPLVGYSGYKAGGYISPAYSAATSAGYHASSLG